MSEFDAADMAGAMPADINTGADAGAASGAAAATPADPFSDDGALDALYDKIAASDDGATTGDVPAAATAEASAAGVDQTSDHPQKADGEPGSSQAIVPPTSWSAEAKALWSNVPPDAQKYIAQREAEAHSKITQLGEAVARFQPVGELVEQRIGVFDRHGITPDEGIGLMLDMQDMLDRDPVTGLSAIAETYGIDLAATFGGTQSGQQQQRVATDPAVKQVLDQNRQLQQRLAERDTAEKRQQESQTQARRQEAVTEVQRWGADKPHFTNPEIRKAMSALYANGLATSLDNAYEQACYANPSIRALIEADAKKAAETANLAEQAKVVGDAKRARSVNLGTRSARPAKAASRWDDDTALEATFDAVSR